ncbi:MAG: SagB/ThcOx family dehydrogenase [Acidobacteria bacterium]|nr:MAG: SagB/ThcOx family dehydrogenase [Acidobacteriota bacterium]
MLGVSLGIAVTSSLRAQPASSAPPIQLPKPQTEGGKPLMQALMQRKSTRAFDGRKLPEPVLSSLLWAAWGMNRPDGKRTAPSAMNKQEIDVYVLLEQGAYVYEAKEHALRPVAAGDLRAQAGSQDFVKTAPLNLVYVVDLTKAGGNNEQDKVLYYGTATGCIAQNVYLYCASEGLVTVVRAYVDKAALAPSLGLKPEQRIVLAQTVGYPAGTPSVS